MVFCEAFDVQLKDGELSDLFDVVAKKMAFYVQSTHHPALKRAFAD